MTIYEEIAIKQDRLRQLMSEKELDAIYVKRQDNFSWLTAGGINYVGLGEMGNCGLLVTRDTAYAITNIVEEFRMRDEERLEALGYPIYSDIWHVPGSETSLLRQLVPSERIGFDHGNAIGVNIANDIKCRRFTLSSGRCNSSTCN